MVKPFLRSRDSVRCVLDQRSSQKPREERIHIISYGIDFSIGADNAKVLEQLLDYLPPDWLPSDSSIEGEVYFLSFEPENLRYSLFYQGEQILRTETLETVLDAFNGHIRLRIGVAVEDRLFVHAGVVGWQGKAIVIPGRSFSGKTTLVAALVKAGAHYYSDEYAIFDANGLVHPYPRPLSVRPAEGIGVQRIPVEDMGGTVGTDPLSVGLIVSTQYQPQSMWNPRQVSSGQAVLNLLDNTLAARIRPEFALEILAHAVSGALSIEGSRGEADEVSIALLNHQKFDKN